MILRFGSDCFRISENSYRFPTEDVSDQSRGESSVGFERPAGNKGSIRDQDSRNASEGCRVLVKLALGMTSVLYER